MELEDVSQFLIKNGFQLASLELLAECHQNNIKPPNNLIQHFKNPEKFEKIPTTTSTGATAADNETSSDGANPFLTVESSSPIPSLGGCGLSEASISNSTPGPVSSDHFDQADADHFDQDGEVKANLDQGESKARLRFQLREAHDEIERLKMKLKTDKPEVTNQTGSDYSDKQDVIDISTGSDLDLLVFDYLERKNYQYSASTMIDEGIEKYNIHSIHIHIDTYLYRYISLTDKYSFYYSLSSSN